MMRFSIICTKTLRDNHSTLLILGICREKKDSRLLKLASGLNPKQGEQDVLLDLGNTYERLNPCRSTSLDFIFEEDVKETFVSLAFGLPYNLLYSTIVTVL